jgi:hypothetical protein
MTSIYQKELTEEERKQLTMDPGNSYEKAFANSLGVTVALITTDKKMVFGRRGGVCISPYNITSISFSSQFND